MLKRVGDFLELRPGAWYDVSEGNIILRDAADDQKTVGDMRVQHFR